MVGPRSSGCRTCVRRRVRCDGTRPHCTRCQRAGFQCSGYTPPIRFMSPVTAGSDTTKISEGSLRRTARQEESRAPSNSPDGQIVISRDGEVSFNMPGLSAIPSPNATPSSYTDDAYCIFFLDRYFCFDNWNDDLQSNKAWFWRAIQAPSQYPISNIASRALITAFFAQAHRTEHLHHYAYHLHGLALKALASQMRDAAMTFDVLSANALLGLYEACSYTSQMAWQKHTKAMRAFYQNMGPDFFKHRPARSLLMLCRMSIISEAIVSREHCFLAEEKWLNILTSDDREASLTVKLGDIVVHAPGMFEGIKELRHTHHLNPENASSKAQELFTSLLQHLQELKNWWHQWSSDPRRLPKTTIVPVTNDADNTTIQMPPPPSSIPGQTSTFPNLEAAAGWCRYHAHVILALRWLRRLMNLHIPHTIPANLISQHGDTPFYISEHEVQKHAMAICSGLHFYSLPRYRHIGAVYMSLPARIAWQYLPEGSENAAWIERLMDFMATHSGFNFPRYTLRDIKVSD